MHQKAKSFFFVYISILCSVVFAENLIKDPGFDKPLPNPSIRHSTYKGMAKVSIFTEDLSWNKCLKLEVLKYRNHSKTKKPFHFQRLYIGGSNGKGLKVTPNTVYNFSFELKGNVPARVFIMQWTGGKGEKAKRLPALKNLSTDEWKIVKGAFKTAPNAKKIAICIDISGYTPNTRPKIGGYLLIDKIFLARKAQILQAFNKIEDRSDIKKFSQRVIVPDKTSGNFVNFKKKVPARAATWVTVEKTKTSFKLKIKCLEPEMDKLKALLRPNGSSRIWNDDSVEIFFAPVKNDRAFSQFVISAGGARWMSFGRNHSSDRFFQWKAEVLRQKDSWIVNVEIPYRLLGWQSKPPSDAAIGFNVARNRKPVPETSVWNFPHGQLRNINYFGMLLADSPKNWFKFKKKKLLAEAEKSANAESVKKIKSWTYNSSPQKLFSQSISLGRQLRLQKLKGMTFVTTRINPSTDPTIPLLPENIVNPPNKISIRAAVNEFKPLPLAITNLTSKLEEYRIVIDSFNKYSMPQNHLKGSNGNYPLDHIRLFRGIRVKDGNGKGHGYRFDPLAPMDPTQTFVVAPKEATPVWAIFNTSGINPGRYQGVIRVIPLGESTRKFSPTDKTIKWYDTPFEIEVLPFELDKKYAMDQSFYGRGFNNPKIFQQLIDYGCYRIWITPWQLKITFNSDGSIAKFDNSRIVKEVRMYRKIAERNNIMDKFKVVFGLNTYRLFQKIINKKRFKFGTPEWNRAFKEYITAVDNIRKKAGLDKKNFLIMNYDEIKEKECENGPLVTKMIREAAPGIEILMSLAPWQIEPEKLEPFIPYVDRWRVWSVKYFKPEYAHFLKKLRAAGKYISFYTCETSMRQNLQKYYRAHAWTALAYKMCTASMYIHIDNLSRYRDWRTAPFGSFALMAGDTPISTIRMECLRIGQNDLRYFKKLSDMFKSTKIKSPALHKEIADFLKNIPEQMGIKEPFNLSLAEITRDRMIDYILHIQSQKTE